jgi:hypothetical protein
MLEAVTGREVGIAAVIVAAADVLGAAEDGVAGAAGVLEAVVVAAGAAGDPAAGVGVGTKLLCHRFSRITRIGLGRNEKLRLVSFCDETGC